jgi:WD40 repeat protein
MLKAGNNKSRLFWGVFFPAWLGFVLDMGANRVLTPFFHPASTPSQVQFVITGAVLGVAWSPDGRLLASASKDGAVRVSLVEEGEVRAHQVACREG